MPDVSNYLVCASQRSGSTLLVESLAATGVAGKPQEFFQYFTTSSQAPQPREWFVGVKNPEILSRLAPLDRGLVDTRDSDEWKADILDHGRSPNGVWGGKLMWNQTPLLIARTRVGAGTLRTAIHALFDGIDPVYIHVYREDVVPQAISMWRAVQTRVWRDEDGVHAGSDDGAVYNAEGIAHLAGLLLDQDRNWRRWFRKESIDPVIVPFGELVGSPTATTARILTAIGQDPDLAPPPPLKPQANARSKEWAARYRADAARNGYPL
ncbi:Stf0 family sulfotransferase [Gordonia sp. CPCC 205515]|uniref:trehalose 2-sulfotransferase n=1 Tax=Gordonia sp. CPCC 205515 TaxID=3140791 RepID=UPI003AF3B0EE